MSKKKELIRWIDSRGTCGGWFEKEDLEHGASEIETIGRVIHEDKKTVSVAGSRDKTTGNILHVMIIPKVCITSRRVLR